MKRNCCIRNIFNANLCWLIYLLILGVSATAQAPIKSKGRKYVVAQQQAGASDQNAGTAGKPFRSISAAAALAGPGDTVLVYDGIYREWVAPARGGDERHPVTYMAAPGGRAIIRGSEIYRGQWAAVEGQPTVFSTKIPESFFTAGFNPFKIVFDKHRGGGRQGQIFLDGIELPEAKEPANTSLEETKSQEEKTNRQRMYEQPGTWFTDDGETIFVHLPRGYDSLTSRLVEISVRRHLFAPVRRAQNYINVKGFIFEHCANDAAFPQVGAVSCRSGQHWTIENNIVRNIKTIGIDIGAEDENPWLLPDILPEDRYLISGHHDIFTLAERKIAGRNRVINNTVSDCGQCGIAGLFSDGSVVVGNTVERCGGVVSGFESGGIKIHGLMDGTVEGNLVRDNEAWGIWLDCGFIGSRVTRNVVVNNKISGIFFECSNGPGLIDNNVIAYNRGDGIYAHDASSIDVSNNLVFGNANFGIYMCVATDRLVPPYHYATGLYENELSASSRERIADNVVIKNVQGAIALPLTGIRAQDNFSDYNLFDDSLNGPRFVQHFRNGEKQPDDEAMDEARKEFMKRGDAQLTGEALEAWKNGKGVAMNLTQWKRATGNDFHSVTTHTNVELDLKTFELVISEDDVANKLHAPPAATVRPRANSRFSRTVDKDFLARPMPAKNLLPGPFQQVRRGVNKILVWPVKVAYPAMPPKVPIEPGPGSDAFKPFPQPVAGKQ